MEKYRPGVDPNRRKGPDTMSKSIRWVAVAGWVLLLLGMIFIDLAKPDFVTVIDHQLGTADNLRTSWNMSLAKVIFYLMIAGFFFGTYGFIANMMRNKRRGDRFRLNLLTLSVVSLFGAVYYLIYF